MNIPIEITTAMFVAILGLQGWILKEIVSLKVNIVRVDDLEKRVDKLEALDPRHS